MATNPLLSFIGNAARQGVANFLNQGATQPAAPTTQPAAPAALTPQQEQLQRFNRAYYAYLANPDMPLDPSESTGTLRGDQQALARARAARMLAAGQSAVAERAAAQGRLQGTDPETGMPIVGAATAAPIVQESPGGVRVAYRNGVPVGFSTAQPTAMRSVTPTAALPNEMAAVQQEATRLAADQSAARMRAAEDLRNAIATAPAVAAAQAAPVAAQTYSFSQPSPPVGQTTPAQIRAGLAPVTNEISPDGATYVATGLPVLRAGAQPAVNAAPPTEADVEEALAEGAEVAPAAEREQVISASERAIQARNNQIATLTRQLADANRRRDAVEIRRLSSAIRALQAVRRGIETGTAADIRPQTAREMRGF